MTALVGRVSAALRPGDRAELIAVASAALFSIVGAPPLVQPTGPELAAGDVWIPGASPADAPWGAADPGRAVRGRESGLAGA